MSIPNQAPLESELPSEIDSLNLHDLYHTENMEFVPDQNSLDTVWEQHQKLAELSISVSLGGNGLESQEKKLPDLLIQPEIVRRNSTTFINPFYQGSLGYQEKNGVDEANGCEQSEVAETDQHAYEEWREYSGRILSEQFHTTHHHRRILEGVYHDANSQISRRFSLAGPVGGYEMTISPLQSSNLQFVVEDPSGKENTLGKASLIGLHRRHSLGGAPHLYDCPWSGCDKVFNRFYNLRSHYRIHSGEKPFTCNHCDGSFARNHDLKRHERTHSKSKPFVCPTCRKSFSRNDALNRHVKLRSCSKSEA